MFRTPILAAFLVLSTLTLAGLASRPAHAAPARQAPFAELASSESCPYADDGEALELPPGHPPVAGAEHRLPAGHPPVPGYTVEDETGALPPGHPPIDRATPMPAPRFDQVETVDL